MVVLQGLIGHKHFEPLVAAARQVGTPFAYADKARASAASRAPSPKSRNSSATRRPNGTRSSAPIGDESAPCLTVLRSEAEARDGQGAFVGSRVGNHGDRNGGRGQDDTKTAKPEKGPTTVATVIVHGRTMKPNASITVNRVPLDACVRELKQPLVDRIAKSADKSPFWSGIWRAKGLPGPGSDRAAGEPRPQPPRGAWSVGVARSGVQVGVGVAGQ